MRLVWLTLVFLILAPIVAATAQDDPRKATGLPVPRFVSLASDEVNMRAGPGIRYPVDWVYRRKGLPMEVTAEFDQWRRIRDIDGTTGWVHQSMLSSRRSVIVTGQTREVREEPSPDSPLVARVEAGVQGSLLECAETWCRVRFGDYRGWLPMDAIWGVYSGEKFG
ncbi:MAG: hypothetical protein CMM50_01340 [Rhodospirillaceae bacterium]|nr:hypothetical protein [Rhodospirillaceae bacterium]